MEMLTPEIKQLLFDICSEKNPSHAYIEAYVKIEDNNITEVSWGFSKIGDLMENEIKEGLTEITPVGIENDGYYVLRGLFPVEHDSDDYRSWRYITGPEIIEFDLDVTLEEYERQQKEWEGLGDVTDLFN